MLDVDKRRATSTAGPRQQDTLEVKNDRACSVEDANRVKVEKKVDVKRRESRCDTCGEQA